MTEQLVIFEGNKIEVTSEKNADVELSETPYDKLTKGKEHYNNKEYDAAVYWLTEAAFDDIAEAYVLLGDIYSIDGSEYKDHNKALSHYEKAYELDNTNKKVIYNLAIGYNYLAKPLAWVFEAMKGALDGNYRLTQPSYKKAFFYAEKCESLTFDDFFIEKYKANCSFYLGTFYESPKTEYNNKENDISNLYEYIPEQKNLNKAIEYYDQAISLDTNNPQFVIQLADLYDNWFHDLDKTFYYLAKCPKMVTEEKEVQARCIVSLIRIGIDKKLLEPAESLELLKMAHALDESNVSYLLALGSNYYSFGDAKNAIFFLEKCLNTQYAGMPKDVIQCSYYLGELYGNKNSNQFDLAKSIKYYQKMQDLQNSEHGNIYLRGMSDVGLFNLAIGYREAKDHNNAVVYLEKCINNLPNEQRATCAHSLGEIYRNVFQVHNKAIEYFELAYQLNNFRIAYIISLVETYSLIQNVEKTNIYLKICADFSSYSSVLEKQVMTNCSKKIGNLFYNKKDYTKALEYFKKVYENDQPNPLNAWNLGVIYKTIHDEQNARHYFEECVKTPNGDPGTISQCTEMLGMSHE